MAYFITVKDVYEAAGQLIKEGKGNKKVLVYSDEDGNGLHYAADLFNDPEGFVSEYMSLPTSIGDIMDNCVLFG